jgi:hypothetical protein
LFGAIGITQGAKRLVVVDVCRAVGARERKEEPREEENKGDERRETNGNGKNTISRKK